MILVCGAGHYSTLLGNSNQNSQPKILEAQSEVTDPATHKQVESQQTSFKNCGYSLRCYVAFHCDSYSTLSIVGLKPGPELREHVDSKITESFLIEVASNNVRFIAVLVTM